MIKSENEILTSKIFATEFQKAMKTTQRKFRSTTKTDEVIINTLLSRKDSAKLSKNLLEVFTVAYCNALRKLDPERYIKFINDTAANVADKLGRKGIN